MTTARKKKALAKKPAPLKKAVKSKKPVVTKRPKAPVLKNKRSPASTVPSSVNKQSQTDPRVLTLVEKIEIAEVLANYARAIDRLDETLLRSILHHDATLDYGPGAFQGTSGDFVYWVLSVFQNVKSSHHLIGNIRIEIDGDTALVESYFQTHIRVEKPIGREDVFWGGRHLDRFERRPAGATGSWKIMHRKQVLDWARTEAASDMFYHQNPDALWSSRTKTDVSYNMNQVPSTQTHAKAPAFMGRHYESKSIKF